MIRCNLPVLSHIQNLTSFRKFFLLFLWLLGILSGCCWVQRVPDSYFSLMRTLVQTRASIVGAILILFLPLVISAFALAHSKYWILYPLVFLKAFMFGFSAGCVMLAFGNAGWLVRWLLLFSDSFMNVCLLWFWFKGGSCDNISRELVHAVLFASIVFCLDYCAVSPFLRMLFLH